MHDATCSNCSYWLHQPDIHEWGIGDCKRYAPKPVTRLLNDIEKEVTTFWPQTAHNDYCGDYAVSNG